MPPWSRPDPLLVQRFLGGSLRLGIHDRSCLEGKGSEGHAEENEGRYERPRISTGHFTSLTEDHDEASRATQQRRSGGRFRYRRRKQHAHHLRTAQDAHSHVFFLAALWCTLVISGVLAFIGTIAFGADTESGWMSVRSAVESGFYTTSCTPSFSQAGVHAQQLPLLPQQLLAPAAPARRSAIFTHGLPHATLQPQGLASAHVSSLHCPWLCVH